MEKRVETRRRVILPSKSTPSKAGQAIRKLLSDGEWHTRAEIDAVAARHVPTWVAFRRYLVHNKGVSSERIEGAEMATVVRGKALVIDALLRKLARKSEDGRGKTRRWKLKTARVAS